jgi:hypothetical protein
VRIPTRAASHLKWRSEIEASTRQGSLPGNTIRAPSRNRTSYRSTCERLVEQSTPKCARPWPRLQPMRGVQFVDAGGRGCATRVIADTTQIYTVSLLGFLAKCAGGCDLAHTLIEICATISLTGDGADIERLLCAFVRQRQVFHADGRPLPGATAPLVSSPPPSWRLYESDSEALGRRNCQTERRIRVETCWRSDCEQSVLAARRAVHIGGYWNADAPAI